MKKKIKEYNEHIKKLKDEINLYENSIKNKTLYNETKLWKERCNMLTNNYLDTIKDLKNKLNEDRKIYSKSLLKLKNVFNTNLYKTFDSYKIIIDKNEKNIKILEKENQILLEKERKLKEAFFYTYEVNVNDYKNK